MEPRDGATQSCHLSPHASRPRLPGTSGQAGVPNALYYYIRTTTARGTAPSGFHASRDQCARVSVAVVST